MKRHNLKLLSVNHKLFTLFRIDKRLLEEINGNKYKPQEVLRIAESLGLSGATGEALPEYARAGGVDSSMEVDSMTDSSSFVSGGSSSFSLDSKGERSRSTDLRQSFDSDYQNYVSSVYH